MRPVGTRLGNVHFVTYIYLYWIYATNNWGKCVSWRVSVHFLGAGPALHCRVREHTFCNICICIEYMLPIFGEYTVRRPNSPGPNCPGPNCPGPHSPRTPDGATCIGSKFGH